MHHGKLGRLICQEFQYCLKLIQKILTQTKALIFVPVDGIRQINFRFFPDADLGCHNLDLRSLITSMAGRPALPSSSYALRRFSISAIWSFVRGRAFCSAAILSHKSSTSCICSSRGRLRSLVFMAECYPRWRGSVKSMPIQCSVEQGFCLSYFRVSVSTLQASSDPLRDQFTSRNQGVKESRGQVT
jgi:hypothetical protein